jgi:hypothetical protein
LILGNLSIGFLATLGRLRAMINDHAGFVARDRSLADDPDGHIGLLPSCMLNKRFNGNYGLEITPFGRNG